MTSNHPKILSNIPEGKDLFKAESHKKISNSIFSIIENQSCSIDKQIIGLEGDWGTGKSNIIKIIEEEISKKEDLKDKYLHYTFDTWTHQEDLTRKSIIIELINSLREKIESFKSEVWIKKENQLSQKRISKNIKHFPRVKLYYIFLVIGFVIIKFINEIKKQNIGGKIFGYYDNSLSYLKNEFYFEFFSPINFTYYFKLFPYLFFLLSFILFFKSLFDEVNKNKKIKKGNEPTNVEKLTFWELVSKSFYWISGEKLETNSDETITENEPSNLTFRKFLNDIDAELISSNKILILTIDNTDRLTNEKLKSIWSTINIFFAENNNAVFLKNIWLIIPFDSKKIIESFDPNIGLGLLEKTFALTFKVPPPLISNWEQFFQLCFDKSFDKIKIEEKQSEIEILLRIFENYEKEITPRRVVNFINQLATYFIQSPNISLRYFAIVVLKKDFLFNGNINENIINRSNYLEKLSTLFIDDDKLELNLAKVIYGVEKDSDAQEALLHSLIEDRLQNMFQLDIDNKTDNMLLFDIDILKLPYFYSYFHKYFKKFIDNSGVEGYSEDNTYFDYVTRVLNELKHYFIKEGKKNIYRGIWEDYYLLIKKNRFTTFNETITSVCENCSKKSQIELINNSIKNLRENHYDPTAFSRQSQILYINFLKKTNSYTNQNKTFTFKDLYIKELGIHAELAIDLINKDKEFYKKLKLTTTTNNLKAFLTKDSTSPFNDTSLEVLSMINFKNEIIFLNQIEKLVFIEEEINTNWLNRSFNSFEQIESLMDYQLNLDKINLDKISNITFSSIINLIINAEENTDLTNAFFLIFINYDKTYTYNIINEFKEAITKFDDFTLQKMILKSKEFSKYQKLFKVLELSIEFDEIQALKDFSSSLLKTGTFKLDDENFNWLLENYTILDSKVFENKSLNLYNYLNRNAKDHKINIKNIDINIIVKSSRFLNTELISKANDYLLKLIENNKVFLQNTTSKEYQLFEKLLILEKIDHKFFNDNFILSFSNLVINNNLPIRISNEIIIKIKSFIDFTKLKSIIEPNLNRIIGRTKIYIFSPEIFSHFDKIQVTHRNKILQNLVNNIDFYNEELFNQVMLSSNLSLINTLKLNLSNHPNLQIKELAIKKGIIKPNPN